MLAGCVSHRTRASRKRPPLPVSGQLIQRNNFGIVARCYFIGRKNHGSTRAAGYLGSQDANATILISGLCYRTTDQTIRLEMVAAPGPANLPWPRHNLFQVQPCIPHLIWVEWRRLTGDHAAFGRSFVLPEMWAFAKPWACLHLGNLNHLRMPSPPASHEGSSSPQDESSPYILQEATILLATSWSLKGIVLRASANRRHISLANLC